MMQVLPMKKMQAIYQTDDISPFSRQQTLIDFREICAFELFERTVSAYPDGDAHNYRYYLTLQEKVNIQYIYLLLRLIQ